MPHPATANVQIESKKDIRLVCRAMNEGWNVDRSKVLDALMVVLETSDSDKLRVEAAKALIKADELNAKREAIQQRQLSGDSDRRLQLLELAQRIPATELAKLASEHGTVIDATSD